VIYINGPTAARARARRPGQRSEKKKHGTRARSVCIGSATAIAERQEMTYVAHPEVRPEGDDDDDDDDDGEGGGGGGRRLLKTRCRTNVTPSLGTASLATLQDERDSGKA